MAIGLPPNHTENLALNDLTPQQFIALAKEAASNLEWEISHLSDNSLIARTGNGGPT